MWAIRERSETPSVESLHAAKGSALRMKGQQGQGENVLTLISNKRLRSGLHTQTTACAHPTRMYAHAIQKPSVVHSQR